MAAQVAKELCSLCLIVVPFDIISLICIVCGLSDLTSCCNICFSVQSSSSAQVFRKCLQLSPMQCQRVATQQFNMLQTSHWILSACSIASLVRDQTRHAPWPNNAKCLGVQIHKPWQEASRYAQQMDWRAPFNCHLEWSQSIFWRAGTPCAGRGKH